MSPCSCSTHLALSWFPGKRSTCRHGRNHPGKFVRLSYSVVRTGISRTRRKRTAWGPGGWEGSPVLVWARVWVSLPTTTLSVFVINILYTISQPVERGSYSAHLLKHPDVDFSGRKKVISSTLGLLLSADVIGSRMTCQPEWAGHSGPWHSSEQYYLVLGLRIAHWYLLLNTQKTHNIHTLYVP